MPPSNPTCLPVSYTHLDVYKRQALLFSLRRAVRCPQNTKTWRHRNGPVFAACVFLTLFAVSNKIYWGNTGIELPLPAKLLELCGIFRSSGRMFYLVAACMVVYAVYKMCIRDSGVRCAAALMQQYAPDKA